jgi:transmembrane sensor
MKGNMPGRDRDGEAARGGRATSLEREATEWFFRRDGGFTAGDERAFNRWLDEDEAHARAFADVEATWTALGCARDHVPLPLALAVLPAGRGKSRVWRQVALAAAAAIVFSGTSWIVARHLGFRGVPTAAAAWAFAAQAATEIGGLRKMDLPDGSFVTLNADSAADVQFTRFERRVRLLRGEAHFMVAKDSRLNRWQRVQSPYRHTPERRALAPRGANDRG